MGEVFLSNPAVKFFFETTRGLERKKKKKTRVKRICHHPGNKLIIIFGLKRPKKCAKVFSALAKTPE